LPESITDGFIDEGGGDKFVKMSVLTFGLGINKMNMPPILAAANGDLQSCFHTDWVEMTLIEIGLREQPVNVSARHEDYLFRDARKAMVVRVFSQFREGDAPKTSVSMANDRTTVIQSSYFCVSPLS
jgi:hypothetical protein